MFDKFLKSITSDSNTLTYVLVAIVVYILYITNIASEQIVSLFDNKMIHLIVIICISKISKKNMETSFLLLIIYLTLALSINFNNKKVDEHFDPQLKNNELIVNLEQGIINYEQQENDNSRLSNAKILDLKNIHLSEDGDKGECHDNLFKKGIRRGRHFLNKLKVVTNYINNKNTHSNTPHNPYNWPYDKCGNELAEIAKCAEDEHYDFHTNPENTLPACAAAYGKDISTPCKYIKNATCKYNKPGDDTEYTITCNTVDGKCKIDGTEVECNSIEGGHCADDNFSYDSKKSNAEYPQYKKSISMLDKDNNSLKSITLDIIKDKYINPKDITYTSKTNPQPDIGDLNDYSGDEINDLINQIYKYKKDRLIWENKTAKNIMRSIGCNRLREDDDHFGYWDLTENKCSYGIRE